MFTFFRNCQIQSERTPTANAARGEALARERESIYQGRPAPPVCWQVFCKSATLTSMRMKCQTTRVLLSLSGARRGLKTEHKAGNDDSLWQTMAFSSMIHQHQLPSARTPHCSKYFQISQSHSAQDQNEQVLWFINCDFKYFYSPHLLGVFVGMGRRQKTATNTLVGLKVSHSTRWPLNTLLFRRETWKGRNAPAGVTNGSVLGTMNPNKLIRVTSKYFGPLSPEQTDKENSSWNSDVDWWTQNSHRVNQLCWKYLGSIWIFTL